MHPNTLSALRRPEISFSIWDDRFKKPGCICSIPCNIDNNLISPRVAHLRINPVFLGLNFARAVSYNFQNFHDTTRRSKDGVLKAYIQDGNLNKLTDTLMTDLLCILGPKSGSVIKEIKENPCLLNQNANRLLNLIETLRNSDKSVCGIFEKQTIICFGVSCYGFLREYLTKNGIAQTVICNLPYSLEGIACNINGLEYNIFRVWHYSNYGIFRHKTLQLKDQLIYINSII